MNIIIFGTSPFSKLVRRYVDEDSKDTVIAFTINKAYIKERYFEDLPVISFEDLEEVFHGSSINILITCGYKNMNELRKKIYYECKLKNYFICDFIHSSSKIETKSIGEGNIILPDVHIAPFVKIGNGNIFFNHVVVNHDTKIGDFNYFSPAFICGGECEIGNNNFYGLRSVLRDSICIGDYNIVGAATYLSSSIESDTLVKSPKCTTQQVKRSVLNKLL